MLAFIIGLMVGGVIGIFVMCLLTAAKESDRHVEYEEYNRSEELQSATIKDTNTDARIIQQELADAEQTLCGSDRT